MCMRRVSTLFFHVLFVCGVLLFGSGCGPSLVAFTHELRAQHGLTKDDLKNLQWYVSHRVTLRRELESGARQVTGNHKLLVMSGKTIEEVVIEELTPGIAVDVGEGSIAVSFEEGSSLVFSSSTGRLTSGSSQSFAQPPDPFPGNNPNPPDPFPGDAGGSFSGNYFLVINPGGKVSFQTLVWDAVDETFQAHLMIDAEKLDEVVENRKVLKGLRLPGR